MLKIGNDWDKILAPLVNGENYRAIREFLKKEYSNHAVYPPMEEIFNAFRLTPYGKVKVVILGQDPYHGYGQAHGLCFSVKKPTGLPPSLVNIYKEIYDDVGIDNGLNGDLTRWAEQGVLLLNTVLTVREGTPNSHKNCGWTEFTDGVIKLLSERNDPIVFILWGANARSKKQIIDCNKHFVLECAHPSPLSAYNGFFGCRHFSETNKILTELGKTPIDWKV